MNTSKLRAVFFDLDGTLIDSASDLAASVNHALALIEKPPLCEHTIRAYIGNGADRLIHRAITRQHQGDAKPEHYEPAREAFLAHYASNVCNKSTLYPAVEEVLMMLKDRGYHLACITNKPSQFTVPLLDALAVKRHFSVVLSGDSLARKKPAPDQLQHAARRFNLTPSECLMIGDTNTDISAALNCDMPAVFVTYGYGAPDDLDERFRGPKIDHMNELHQHL